VRTQISKLWAVSSMVERPPYKANNRRFDR
jgi:hypothetical protein